MNSFTDFYISYLHKDVIHINYHAHKIGGVCAGLTFAIATMPESNKITYISIITVSSLLGSLLPDIDEPRSYIGKKFKPVSRIIKATAGHRGLFHTLLICFLFPLIYFLIKDIPQIQPYDDYISLIFIGLSAGYLSHLLMDMMTISGVPLLWPIINRKISILPLKTNRDEWIAILLFIIPVLLALNFHFKFF